MIEVFLFVDYSVPKCKYLIRDLREKGVHFWVVDVNKEKELVEKHGVKGVPSAVIGEKLLYQPTVQDIIKEKNKFVNKVV